MRKNGDVLPTLLVDGFVAGVWRAVEGGIEATAFDRLPDDAWDGPGHEARRSERSSPIASRGSTAATRTGGPELPKGEVRLLGA